MKILIVILASTMLAPSSLVVAQTASVHKAPAHKPAAKPTASGPTKVTGASTKTASGLEYWDIKVGTGAVAQSGKHVKVDYTGWLTNGKKFDSSVDRKKPFVFPLGSGQTFPTIATACRFLPNALPAIGTGLVVTFLGR